MKRQIQSHFDDLLCQLTCHDVVLVTGDHAAPAVTVVNRGHVYWRQAELTDDVIDNSGDQSARVVN